MSQMVELVETARLEKRGAAVLVHRQIRQGKEVWVLNVAQVAAMNGVESLPPEVQSAQYEFYDIEERNRVCNGILDSLLSTQEAQEAVQQQLADSFQSALPKTEESEPVAANAVSEDSEE